jgi:aminobenzoyl-glutamate utilization protein B
MRAAIRVATPVMLAMAAIPIALALQADPKAAIVQALDARRDEYARTARQIWEFAEVGYQEEKSSALLQQTLAGAGFKIEAGVAEIPTAFVATFGSGQPVIAIIGEFDALPGLSQHPEPARHPIVENAPGHGCGHNLFGTGSAAAAIAVKNWLAASGRGGTVRFYGTPAEEGGSGKVYMLRSGLFKDVDVALAWHAGDRNEASPSSSLANKNAKFRFYGTASHASAAPHRGRSALDAVEAMNFMVNLLREHVPQETRMHYVITRGGDAPNIVPGFAEVYHYARHPDIRVLDDVWARIVKAAEAAALGTGTRMEHEIIGAVYNVLPNEHLSSLAHRNLERVGGVTYTPDEQRFALDLRKSLDGAGLPLGSERQIQPPRAVVGTASTDLGDVSWNVPTVSVTAATWVPGVPAHSWQAVACSGTSIGVKGMMVAAKTLALTAADLFQTPADIEAAKAEFRKRVGSFVYAPRLGDRKPALDYRR